MQDIKSVLEKFLRKTGMDKPVLQNRALVVWNEVVGDTVAGRAQPEEVKHGVLVVKVDTPVWRNELSLRKSEIVKALNRAIGESVIKDIRLI
ncbi:MAG: DUF721 domain-containing protein [Fidelibacterota bacterium]